MDEACEQFKLKIQALADGEIDKNDSQLIGLFKHLSTCHECREEYYQIVKLNNDLNVKGHVNPPEEWFTEIDKKRSFKLVRNIGIFLIITPFILLMGGALWEMLNSSDEIFIFKISVVTMIIGFIILLGYTFAGKIKEDKNDKYREILR